MLFSKWIVTHLCIINKSEYLILFTGNSYLCEVANFKNFSNQLGVNILRLFSKEKLSRGWKLIYKKVTSIS